jgi:predicted ribosomally synthesized peptide with SipW-like signal peptide
MMMKRIALVCIAVVIALGLVGTSYAYWNQNLYINTTVKTGELDWIFCSFSQLDVPGVGDWVGSTQTPFFVKPLQMEYDIAVSSGGIRPGDAHYIDITVDNAYRSYYNCYFFSVKNTGTMPIKIRETVLYYAGRAYRFTGSSIITTEDGVFQLRWQGNHNRVLQPGKSEDESLEIYLLNPEYSTAEETRTYDFTITLSGVQVNSR